MNLLNILSHIEQVDPEIYDRLDSRRRVFKHMAGFGKKLSAAALPFAFGAILNKAYGQASTALVPIQDALNFALKLEYLEMYFYQAGLGSTSLQAALGTVNRDSLRLIATDEANHVNFLRTTITALGFPPTADPTATMFDFKGSQGGARAALFPDVLTNPATFLAVAQAMEDTGVRAYKGAAVLQNVMSNNVVLEAALNIHSVEARHSARIRTMRRGGPTNDRASMTAAGTDLNAMPKSWISGTDNGGPAPAATAMVYGAGSTPGYLQLVPGISFPAEDNTIQANVRTTTNTSVSGFPSSAFSEAFDEPLNALQVNLIANNFVASTNPYFTPVM